MPKFRAKTIHDLLTAEAAAGRAIRRPAYVVACEASDGSWCEFDAESFEHAKVLAQNAVANLGSRGCSVRSVNVDGTVGQRPCYVHYREIA